jgi:hypothetical protein
VFSGEVKKLFFDFFEKSLASNKKQIIFAVPIQTDIGKAR